MTLGALATLRSRTNVAVDALSMAVALCASMDFARDSHSTMVCGYARQRRLRCSASHASPPFLPATLLWWGAESCPCMPCRIGSAWWGGYRGDRAQGCARRRKGKGDRRRPLGADGPELACVVLPPCRAQGSHAQATSPFSRAISGPPSASRMASAPLLRGNAVIQFTSGPVAERESHFARAAETCDSLR